MSDLSFFLYMNSGSCSSFFGICLFPTYTRMYFLLECPFSFFSLLTSILGIYRLLLHLLHDAPNHPFLIRMTRGTNAYVAVALMPRCYVDDLLLN